MPALPNDRLHKILGSPLLEPLVSRLAKRLAKRPEAIGRMTLSKLSHDQAEAVRALMGAKPSDATRVPVDLAQLERIVTQSGAAESLVGAIESLTGGSLVDQAAEREAKRTAWRTLPQSIDEFDALPDGVQEWIVRSCENGSLQTLTRGDLAEATRIIQTTAAASRAIPLDLPMPLAAFAQSIAGDSHAFDSSTSLGRFLVRTIAATNDFDPTRCDSIEQRREIWGSIDVVLDELSSTVLLLNVPATGDSLTDRVLRDHAVAGQPLRLTFRHLRVTQPAFESLSGRHVFVCENPTVVTMAADRLGPQCAPLICTEGVPSHAVRTLLRLLSRAGANINYHGDFDWAGIRIAGSVMSRDDAKPWRMSDADYLQAAEGRALRGKPVETPWCPALRDAMISRGKVVLEEEVVDLLISDLRECDRST